MKTLIIINALLCALIALRLCLFRRCGGTHRPWAARLAYLLILLTASVPIRVAFGVYTCLDVSELAINAVLCVAVFAVRGNVVDLFRCGMDYENWITRLLSLPSPCMRPAFGKKRFCAIK